MIDDDDIVLFLHVLYVKENFIDNSLTTFKSAENAIDYFKHRPDAATKYLVFVDIIMPRMTGWDFIEAIQLQPFYKKMHIIMATSSIDFRDKEKAKWLLPGNRIL